MRAIPTFTRQCYIPGLWWSATTRAADLDIATDLDIGG